MNPFSAENRKEYPLKRRIKNLLRSTLVLLLFLTISCSLVYGVATIGIQRETVPWLDIDLKNRTLADYSVDEQGEAVARVRQDVIEDAERDALVATIAAAPAPGATDTPTPTPASSPSPTGTITPTPTPAEVVVDAGGPYEGDEGSRIPVEANLKSLLNILPGSITYRWDMDNDGFYDDQRGKIASVIFFDEGIYTIGVQTTDLLGRTATDTARVIISNVPPLVRVGPDMTIDEAETAFFEATANDPGNDVLFYEWDFGDGTQVVLDTLSPEHTYRDDGLYEVRLRVSDEDEAFDEDTLLVRVLNQPPLIDAGADRTVNEGDTITLSGTATDPAGVFDTLTYAWDLNYNGSTFQPDAFGPQVSSYYPDGPSTRVAALQVTDDDGGVALDTLRVTVENETPAITNISNNSPVAEGSSVTVQVQATDVSSDTLTYSYDWENDGNFDLTRLLSASASHTWSQDGKYLTGVRVEDGDGGRIFATTAISIYNVAPTAIVNGPTSGTEGSTLNFNANDSSDPGADTLSYQWNFGDGSAPTSGLNASHFYADNGVYSGTLTVNDNDGGLDTSFFNVTISNVNPVADAGGDRTVQEGETIPLDASASSDVGPNDTLTYEWDFSYDGSTFNKEAEGPSVSRLYPDGPASSEVALRVRDKDYPATLGEIGQSLDIIKITVENQAPTNVAIANVTPSNPFEGQMVTLTAADAIDPAGANDTLTYEWDIDDDGDYELTGKSVIHTWNTADTYPVTLRVRDEDGGTTLASTNVPVGDSIPIADLSAGEPYVVDENSPIVLDGRLSTDLSDTTPPFYDQLTFDWNFGDGTILTNTTTVTRTHTYADNNVYTVILTVRDADGDTDTDTTMVTVNNLPPIADVSAGEPYVVDENSPIVLDGRLSTDPSDTTPPTYDQLTFDWNFGDGTVVTNTTTVTRTHTYPDNNVYTVTLTVRDPDGGTDTDTTTIQVNNLPPTATIVVNPDPPVVDEGQQVNFNGLSSTDPSPSGSIDSYRWNFGDGSPPVNGNIVFHTYDDNGIYNAQLTVTDNDGAIGTTTEPITVNNVAPTAVITSSTLTALEGTPIIFGSGNSTDPGNDTLTYSWLADDGTTNTLFANTTSTTTSYPFPDQGIYTVTLQVDDGDGGLGTDAITVTIQNVAPTAVMTSSTLTGSEGVPITFGSGNSTDPGNDTLTYSWSVDDGTTTTVIANTANTSYAFPDQGVYTVTLQVDDGDGGVDSDTNTLTIQNVAPTAVITSSTLTGTEGLSITFGSGNSTDSGPNDTLTYSWSVTDGITTTLITTTTNLTTSYTFPDDGVYTVTLQVDDGDGGLGTDAMTVTIQNVAPTVNAGGPYTTTVGAPITLTASGNDVPPDLPLIYTWDLDEDGLFDDGTGASVTFTNVVTPGLYTVTVAAADGDGGLTTDTTTVQVNSVLPFILLGGLPYYIIKRRRLERRGRNA